MIKLLVACLALSVSSMAYGNEPILLMPTAGPGSLQLETKSGANLPTEATFKGTIWVSGRLVLPALGGFEPQRRFLTIILVPTQSDSALLPHYKNYPEAVIQPKNKQYLLAQIFPQSLQDKLKHGEQEHASVVGRFKFESLRVGVECGTQWAHTVISEFQIEEPIQLTAVDLPGGC